VTLDKLEVNNEENLISIETPIFKIVSDDILE
jgi:hypothetical protein